MSEQNNDQQNTGELSPLEIEALRIDQEFNQQQQKSTEQPQQPSLNAAYYGTVLAALKKAASFGNVIMPFTSQCFNEGACEDIAENLIKVADVEKVDLKKVFGEPNSRIGAWVALALSVGAPSFMFWLALQEYKPSKPSKPNEKEVQGDIVTTGSPNPEDLKEGFHA